MSRSAALPIPANVADIITASNVGEFAVRFDMISCPQCRGDSWSLPAGPDHLCGLCSGTGTIRTHLAVAAAVRSERLLDELLGTTVGSVEPRDKVWLTGSSGVLRWRRVADVGRSGLIVALHVGLHGHEPIEMAAGSRIRRYDDDLMAAYLREMAAMPGALVVRR